jgi:hypothetical protein
MPEVLSGLIQPARLEAVPGLNGSVEQLIPLFDARCARIRLHEFSVWQVHRYVPRGAWKRSHAHSDGKQAFGRVTDTLICCFFQNPRK